MKLKEEYISKEVNTRLYQTPVPVIGLTGGIASGKSTVSKKLEEKGFPIICADALVHQIYDMEETKNFISHHFPQVINNSTIDFKKLREVFFDKPENQSLIEKFIYKKMPQKYFEAYQSYENAEVVIYDVPLLFEKGLDKLVDLKVCVYAPENVQIERITKRDGSSEELAKNILSKQMSSEEKKKLSDVVINNIKSLEDLDKSLNEFIRVYFSGN